MATVIASQADFDRLVKTSSGVLLLLFYGANSNPAKLREYEREALDYSASAGKNLQVLTANLDVTTLAEGDLQTYAAGRQTICCSTVRDGRVISKRIRPVMPAFRRMIRELLSERGTA